MCAEGRHRVSLCARSRGPIVALGAATGALLGVLAFVWLATTPEDPAALPLPDDPDLRQVALETGLLGPNMIGLTLGYGIYVCDGHMDNRLISHECRHVHQYEVAGSIESYLPIYLRQIAVHGYHDAPFEIDAREHEINAV